MKEFIKDPQIIFQFIGGFIAMGAAIFALFSKNTYNEFTHKLTKQGWIALFCLLLGAAINIPSKYIEYFSRGRC